MYSKFSLLIKIVQKKKQSGTHLSKTSRWARLEDSATLMKRMNRQPTRAVGYLDVLYSKFSY
jgi:hypothetical protein